MSKPYTVWTPNFVPWSGGIRVLHGLVEALRKKDQEVLVNAIIKDSDSIAVYPELANGNPLQGSTVVRWILSWPGFISGSQGEFDKTDKIFIFSKIYNTLGVDDNHTMFLPAIDINIFHKTNFGKRTKKCKYISKGIDQHLPELEGVEELHKEMAVDQQALADYLNECEVLYSYDPASAIFECARLCGCRVVIIPNKGYQHSPYGKMTKEEFSQYEPGMNGISWGLKENNPLDADKFMEHYIDMMMEFDRKLNFFIEDTQR
jgi:hypothetical protein